MVEINSIIAIIPYIHLFFHKKLKMLLILQLKILRMLNKFNLQPNKKFYFVFFHYILIT